MDMHSGGSLKQPPFEYIYIEAEIEIAEQIFNKKFGHDPYDVSCSCCGENYSVSEYTTLEEATDYERCRSILIRIEKPISLEDYRKLPYVLIIEKDELA
jgi:hypothetical protein